MASKEIAMMLDELMGRNRNSDPNEKQEELTWESRGVCPYFLVDYCPHELFTNTKADLGACSKIHNDALKHDYVAASDTHPKKIECQEDMLRIAQRLVGDLQTKIRWDMRRSKERMTLTVMEQQAANGVSPQQQEEIESKVNILTDKINELVTQAETAGNAGDIEEAQGLLKLCDTLKEERDELKQQIGLKQGLLGAPPTKPAPMEPPAAGQPCKPTNPETGKMSGPLEYLGIVGGKHSWVCEICGAFLNFWVGTDNQNQSRVDDHLMGKLHIGYAKLRGTVDKLGEELNKKKEALEKEREEKRKEREGEKKETVFERNARLAKEGGEDKDKDKKKSRSRSRDKDRDDRSKSRRKSRSKSRDRKRDRSRSSDRRRRDRSRDRKERRRSRDRRDRSRDRRSSRDRKRDRSRDRRRRSRSRS